MRSLTQLALFIVLVLSFLYAQLDLRRASWKLERSNTVVLGPDLPIQPVFLLNYGTLTADIGWIDTLIRHGESRRSGLSTTTALIERGHHVVEIDPLHYSIYLWVPAAYMSQKHIVSEHSLARISELMDRGIRHFPDDSELPFSAAMNFIGHSDFQDKPRRVRELQRALAYLNIATNRPSAWEDMPGLIAALARRLRDLQSETGETESAFLEDFMAMLGPERAPGLWQILPLESRERIAYQHQIAADECVGYLPQSLCDALSAL